MEVALYLVVGDLRAVPIPLNLFIVDKTAKDVFTQSLAHELALLRELDRFPETAWKGLNSHRSSIRITDFIEIGFDQRW